MLPDGRTGPVTPAEYARILRVFGSGLLLRFAVLLTLHLTGVEHTLRLTSDAFLYDKIGKQIAEHYRTGGRTEWPARVSGVLDHLYEHVVGITYYLTDDSMLVVRVINAICGSLVILVTWRMARCVTDVDTAFRCGLWACFFPTQIYYSCVGLRDAQSMLAMSLVFLGMTAVTSSGKVLHIMALPLGVLLMAGYRAYLATALVLLIPASWIFTLLVTWSEKRCQPARLNLLVSILAATALIPVALPKFSSTTKAGMAVKVHRWNDTRREMNSGSGALYQDGAIPTVGKSVVDTGRSVIVGLYFFLVSVNPAEMNSLRQWMALPEVLIVLYMIPNMFRGLRHIVCRRRFELLSVLLVTAAITIAYSSVTTNAGPLMRWRLQVVNIYIVAAAIGFARSRRNEEDHGTAATDTATT